MLALQPVILKKSLQKWNAGQTLTLYWHSCPLSFAITCPEQQQKQSGGCVPSSIMELARENLVFIPIWIKDGYQRLWNCLLSRGQGSRLCLRKGRGRKSRFHCLLSLPVPCPAPPNSIGNFIQKRNNKIKSCKEVKVSRFCCMEKRKRTIWMRKRRHKMYVKKQWDVWSKSFIKQNIESLCILTHTSPQKKSIAKLSKKGPQRTPSMF